MRGGVNVKFTPSSKVQSASGLEATLIIVTVQLLVAHFPETLGITYGVRFLIIHGLGRIKIIGKTKEICIILTLNHGRRRKSIVETD